MLPIRPLGSLLLRLDSVAVDLCCLGGVSSPPPEAGAVAADAQAALQARGIPHTELSVVLTDDATIQSLNREYRGIDRPTDVLSFAQQEGAAPDEGILGDLIISLETARRQAEERGHSLASEVRILLVHGLLHLLGMDHKTDKERIEMARAEQSLLAALPEGPEGPTNTGLVSLQGEP